MPPSDARRPGIFLNRRHELRNGWWIAAFLALLAAMLFPSILLSARFGHALTIWEQVALIGIATIVIQAMRRKPLAEVTGPASLKSLAELGLGMGAGFLMMAVPAVVLFCAGWVRFEATGLAVEALLPAVLAMAGVAIAEELLFRGVLFQRLVAGLGVWPAQAAIGLLFVLTHLNNPGMEGATRVWAGANIFLASVLFGAAFLRTRSLAAPIGLHFMANLTQGVLLGFGVSGNAEPSLLSPRFLTDAEWLTGGAFGLEASLPGLVAVVLTLLLLKPSRPSAQSGPA